MAQGTIIHLLGRSSYQTWKYCSLFNHSKLTIDYLIISERILKRIDYSARMLELINKIEQ